MSSAKSTDGSATAHILYSDSVKPLENLPPVVTQIAPMSTETETEKPATECKVQQMNVAPSEPQVISNGLSSVRLDGGKVTITACEELSFTCGEATLTLKKDGTIKIQGVNKALIAGGESAMELSDSGAALSAPAVDVTSAETTQITGKVVKIN